MTIKHNTNAGTFEGNSRGADKFVVRLPEGMRPRINDLAKKHLRSMNSEIIASLEKTLLAEELYEASGLDDSVNPPTHLCSPVANWVPQRGQYVWISTSKIAHIEGIVYSPLNGLMLELNTDSGPQTISILKVKPLAL